MFPTPPTLTEGTDNWRLFHALSDGEVHDHHELYGLRMIVHSRKSDLVHKHGCTIRCWSKAGTSYYQMKGVPQASARDGGDARSTPMGLPESESTPHNPVSCGAAEAPPVDPSFPGSRRPAVLRQPTLWENAA